MDRAELDLSDVRAVSSYFESRRPDAVVLCAAKVGGVAAHAAGQYSMLHDNLAIQNAVIDSSYRNGVSRLLFVSSGTVYPSVCEQPIPESAMFTGPFDPLHESYALAKITGMKLCEKIRTESGRDFFSLVPTNMYGEGDTFEDGRSNVVCSLLKRFFEARNAGNSEVVVWGTGNALRDFLYVDDMADAILHFLDNPPEASYLNIGSDQEVSISNLAKSIGYLVGYE
ncbi:MAG: NAD-dependent epimerase/dehydratase family protein [Patescibacteria group bacterium]